MYGEPMNFDPDDLAAMCKGKLAPNYRDNAHKLVKKGNEDTNGDNFGAGYSYYPKEIDSDYGSALALKVPGQISRRGSSVGYG